MKALNPWVRFAFGNVLYEPAPLVPCPHFILLVCGLVLVNAFWDVHLPAILRLFRSKDTKELQRIKVCFVKFQTRLWFITITSVEMPKSDPGLMRKRKKGPILSSRLEARGSCLDVLWSTSPIIRFSYTVPDIADNTTMPLVFFDQIWNGEDWNCQFPSHASDILHGSRVKWGAFDIGQKFWKPRILFAKGMFFAVIGGW